MFHGQYLFSSEHENLFFPGLFSVQTEQDPRFDERYFIVGALHPAREFSRFVSYISIVFQMNLVDTTNRCFEADE